jgi:hypothetical protein
MQTCFPWPQKSDAPSTPSTSSGVNMNTTSSSYPIPTVTASDSPVNGAPLSPTPAASAYSLNSIPALTPAPQLGGQSSTYPFLSLRNDTITSLHPTPTSSQVILPSSVGNCSWVDGRTMQTCFPWPKPTSISLVMGRRSAGGQRTGVVMKGREMWTATTFVTRVRVGHGM